VNGAFEPALAGANPGGRVLDFKRRPAPPRRRKRSVWLALVRPLATAFALVAVPGGLIAWVLTSSRFYLRDLSVEGTHRVSADRLRQTLAPLRGENLVRLPLSRIETLLRSQPWIESVEIEKVLPDRVRVSIRERRPVALLAGAGGELSWADPSGHPIARVAPGEKTEGFLVVDLTSAGPDAPAALSQALDVAAELGRAKRAWASGLTRVDVLGEGDFRLHTKDLAYPLLVRRSDLVLKVHRFEELLPELERRYQALEAVDLRFARRIVIEPAAVPGVAQKSLTNGGTG